MRLRGDQITESPIRREVSGLYLEEKRSNCQVRGAVAWLQRTCQVLSVERLRQSDSAQINAAIKKVT
jgi:hypothetical protein